MRDVRASLIEFDDVNRYLGGMITVLDIRYPVDDRHPLAGRRVPDADLKTSDGDTHVFALPRIHLGSCLLASLHARSS
ncbi:hypothetical protein AB0D04_37835 [Streptomyces sp. NPDC048483]|uniref:hypothetical protein n=1 Tax=Streptomyces sp. NPDC048483 TaxID=3154927 RepID=UPI003442A77A